jgi:hypothetical protein
MDKHRSKAATISKQLKDYSNSTKDKKLRFYKGSSNSTRSDEKGNYYWVDISELNEIITVDKKGQFVIVEPNVPMDKLVSETLKYGFIPRVVMEFPGITVGGGINGAALESSSFKYGQFNDNALEYEHILGSGEIITSSPKQKADLFYGISGSYGSLGLLSLIKLKLIKASEYVRVSYIPAGNYEEALKKLDSLHSENLDFLEAIVFDPKNTVIITGVLTNEKSLPIKTYSKARDPWFYEKGKKVKETGKEAQELVPIFDYLFRYNRGAFWMGEFVFPFLHIPNNKITKFVLNPIMNTRKLFDGLHSVNMGQDWLVQDFYLPYKNVQKFLQYCEKDVKIYPLWLCPMKSTNQPQKLSPHYISSDKLVDIGVWGQTDKYLKDPIAYNRKLEAEIKQLDGRKMLYAHQYYTKEEFWSEYDKSWYESLRKKYKSDAFPDVWEKTNVKERYKMSKWKGTLKVLLDTFRGRNVNT